MSISLHAVALHQLDKNEQDELVVRFSAEAHQADAYHETLIQELHRNFTSKTKGFAKFRTDSDVKTLIGTYLNNTVDFMVLSKKCSEKLRGELSKYPFADTGTLVFAKYQSLATDYLMVGLIPSNNGMRVLDDLNLSATAYLDTVKVELMAVVDLTALETQHESNRYISFVKGRVGRKVSDFFLDFLDAEVGLNAKEQNIVLMQAIEDFLSGSDKSESLPVKKQVADYCNDQINHGEEVDVKELSSELPPNAEGKTFIDYTNENGYELEDSFPGDRPTVRKLTKYVGAGGGLNISFDTLLLGERVFYDVETDTLTIKGTPPNLRDQLTRQARSK